MAAILPLSADQNLADSNPSYTFISVSNPGWAIAEVNSLCMVSLPGTTAPLRLKIVQGIADPKGVFLESEAYPGYFLRHQNGHLKLHPYPENDELFAADSTFYLVHNADGTVSFRSYNYPQNYISVTTAKELYIAIDLGQPARSFILRSYP